MRIVIAGQTYYPGNNGQAIFTIHLAEGLARAGHQVAVIVPSNRFSYHLEEINHVQVHRLHAIPLSWLHSEVFMNPLPGLKIRSILEDFKPDIYHAQDHYLLNFDGVRIARRLKIPVIATNHFLPENVMPYLKALPLPRNTKIAALWSTMLWTYNLAHMITTPTETAANILSRQNVHPPIFHVSCGVDTEWFIPKPGIDRTELRRSFGLDPERITFLYVGRQDREKRIDLLIKGLAHLLKDPQHSGLRPRVQLAVAGQGAASHELQVLAASLMVQDEVKFLGYVPAKDLPDLFRASDVFCMASSEELQSIATLEAMASGLPVLAANARALPELVAPAVNGMLFEPGKAEEVAQGMAWMIEHEDEWERLGWAGRSKAKVHSLENTIRRYAELYGQVIEAYPNTYHSTSKVNNTLVLK